MIMPTQAINSSPSSPRISTHNSPVTTLIAGVVFDVDAHVLSEHEYYGSMGISMWIDMFWIGLRAIAELCGLPFFVFISGVLFSLCGMSL